MSCSTSYTALIFDIGDVLFSWSPETKTSISPRQLKEILSAPTWLDYERAQITQDICYERVGKAFSFSPREIAKAFDEYKALLQSNERLISFIRELKSASGDKLRVFAMSKISLIMRFFAPKLGIGPSLIKSLALVLPANENLTLAFTSMSLRRRKLIRAELCL